MKKFVLWVVLVLFILLQVFVVVKWEEGKYYEEIDKLLSDLLEVVEFFFYWCLYCYCIELFVVELKKLLDEGVKFEKVYVNFMFYVSQEVQDEVIMGMLIVKVLKQEDKLSVVIFNYIYKQCVIIIGMKDICNIFIINGVDLVKFDKLVKSFGVKLMLGKNNKVVEDYCCEVCLVFIFIVNGKYKVQIGCDLMLIECLELFNYLVVKCD